MARCKGSENVDHTVTLMVGPQGGARRNYVIIAARCIWRRGSRGGLFCQVDRDEHSPAYGVFLACGFCHAVRLRVNGNEHVRDFVSKWPDTSGVTSPRVRGPLEPVWSMMSSTGEKAVKIWLTPLGRTEGRAGDELLLSAKTRAPRYTTLLIFSHASVFCGNGWKVGRKTVGEGT